MHRRIAYLAKGKVSIPIHHDIFLGVFACRTELSEVNFSRIRAKAFQRYGLPIVLLARAENDHVLVPT